MDLWALYINMLLFLSVRKDIFGVKVNQIS